MFRVWCFVLFFSKPLQDGKKETASSDFQDGKSVRNVSNPRVLGGPGLVDWSLQCGGCGQLLQDTRFSVRHSTCFSSEFGLKHFASLIFKSFSLPPGKNLEVCKQEHTGAMEVASTKSFAVVLRN